MLFAYITAYKVVNELLKLTSMLFTIVTAVSSALANYIFFNCGVTLCCSRCMLISSQLSNGHGDLNFARIFSKCT